MFTDDFVWQLYQQSNTADFPFLRHMKALNLLYKNQSPHIGGILRENFKKSTIQLDRKNESQNSEKVARS
jgi:hypothetical protein